MSDIGDKRYLIRKGRVNELIEKFEVKSVIQKCTSEPNLVIGGLAETQCEELHRSHENLNYKGMYTKENETDKPNYLHGNLYIKENMDKQLNYFKDTSKINNNFTNKYSEHIRYENEQNLSPKANTLPRKPIPAPRRTDSVIKHNIEDSNTTAKYKAGLDGTFYDAKNTMHVESFRRKFVAEMDKSILKMKNDGFINRDSVIHDDNDCYSDESSSNLKSYRDSVSVCENTSDISSNFDDDMNNITSRNRKITTQDARMLINDSQRAHTPLTARTSEPNDIMYDRYIPDKGNVQLPPNLKPGMMHMSKPNISKAETNSTGNTPPNEDYEAMQVLDSADRLPDLCGYDRRAQEYFNGARTIDIAEINPKVNSIIEHLKTTEKRHLQELTEVIPVYTYAVKHHTSLEVRTRAKVICATVQRILELQTAFQYSLAQAVSLDLVLSEFMHHDDLFFAYRQFFVGSSGGIIITIGDVRNDFCKEIILGAILNQRLVHYRMFLEEIKAELAGHSEFLQVIFYPLDTLTEILQSCNKALLLEKVYNNPLRTNNDGHLVDGREDPRSLCVQSFDVTGYGDYLLKDKFKVQRPTEMQLMIFLFKNIMLLTREEKTDVFYYQGHIKMNEIFLLPEGRKKKVLKFRHFVKPRSDVVYKLEASTIGIQKTWRNQIEELLWTQNLKIREEVHKRYGRTSNEISEFNRTSSVISEEL